ncbi:hypothetical protein AB0F43_24640 [Kribbella sp. NPDC023972]|uniref:hypothetical protein n=1 Tax=Kribbella sp. NPDC023972 TaxID=3154795 RepID=UPI0033E446D0
MSVRSVPADVVRQLVELGRARPLFEGFEVGPTWHQGEWWYVPDGAGDGADYVPAGPELSAHFDRSRSRIDRIETYIAGSGAR